MPRQNPFSTLFLLATLGTFLDLFKHAEAFTAFSKSSRTSMTCSQKSTTMTTSSLSYKNSNDDDNNDWQVLNQRLEQMRLDVLEQELQRPPNPQLSATEFVQRLLQCVWDNADPLPEAGFRLLLRTATDEWKAALYASVGAPATANQDVVASALGDAMGRPDNQYAILVGSGGSNNDSDDTRMEYAPCFPTEPLDYFDGTAWVECHLRDKRDNSLLVSTGWQLKRNAEGAWMVAGIDWQDFRDQFRPGIGREEWMRICN